jgi:hypothetical protein
VIGDSFQLQYDGILGRDFWEKNAVISYCNREILMEDIIIKFDPKDSGVKEKDVKCYTESQGTELCEASHRL